MHELPRGTFIGTPFDAQQEVSAQDQREIVRVADVYRKEQEWESFVGISCFAITARPDFRFQINVTQRDWDAALKWFKQLESTMQLEQMFKHAARLKLVFPDHFTELDFNSSWSPYFRLIETARQDRNWWEFSLLARYASVVLPERRNELALTDEVFEGMQLSMGQLRTESRWAEFSHQLASGRLLFGKPYTAWEVSVEDWRGMRSSLDSYRQARTDEGWFFFAKVAANMTIAATGSSTLK